MVILKTREDGMWYIMCLFAGILPGVVLFQIMSDATISIGAEFNYGIFTLVSLIVVSGTAFYWFITSGERDAERKRK